jgi:hypothetical protein
VSAASCLGGSAKGRLAGLLYGYFSVYFICSLSVNNTPLSSTPGAPERAGSVGWGEVAWTGEDCLG